MDHSKEKKINGGTSEHFPWLLNYWDIYCGYLFIMINTLSLAKLTSSFEFIKVMSVVKGEKAQPLDNYLVDPITGFRLQWNFGENLDLSKAIR